MISADCLYFVLGVIAAGVAYFLMFKGGGAGYEGFADTKQFSRYAKKSPYEDPDAYTLLSVTNVQGKGGTLKKKATLFIPNAIRGRHMLVLGKKGSGVMSRVTLPVLINDILDPDRSVVVFDTRGEMWANLANMVHRYAPDKKIVRFNPLEAEKSMSWNFVSHLKDEFECGRMSRLIFSLTEGGFSEGSPEAMRALALLQAVFFGCVGEQEEVSIPRVYTLLQGGRESLVSWINSHPDSARIASSFLELSVQNPSEAEGVINEILRRLHLWENASVHTLTAESEINFEELAARPSVCILEFDETSLDSLRPLASILFCELLRGVIAHSESCPGNRLAKPVGIVCPDFGAVFGKIPALAEKLNSLSSRNVSVLAVVNSIDEIRLPYQESSSLVLGNFHTRMVLPPLDSEDAAWAAREFGYSGESEDGAKEYPGPEQFLVGKELQATFQLPLIPPFQANLVPFFQNQELIEKFNSCKLRKEADIRDF